LLKELYLIVYFLCYGCLHIPLYHRTDVRIKYVIRELPVALVNHGRKRIEYQEVEVVKQLFQLVHCQVALGLCVIQAENLVSLILWVVFPEKY